MWWLIINALMTAQWAYQNLKKFVEWASQEHVVEINKSEPGRGSGYTYSYNFDSFPTIYYDRQAVDQFKKDVPVIHAVEAFPGEHKMIEAQQEVKEQALESYIKEHQPGLLDQYKRFHKNA
jgi:hypothetical protein